MMWGARWTEDRVAKLRAMWLDGKTSSQIARDLGGVTRSAVIGKAARMGLPQHERCTTPVREE
jgi:GcrA cell cycle regulator